MPIWHGWHNIRIKALRFLYTLIWCLASSFVVLRLLLLSRKNPTYRQRIGERFGLVRPLVSDKKIIWIHAVSVGETQASAALVDQLKQQYPKYQILFTTTTPTGAEHVRRIFDASISHRYFPYDIPICTQLFLNRIKPQILLVMETELWPNLFHQCKQQSIPVIIINARLSERSAKRYAMAKILTSQLLQNVSVIACRSEQDAARYKMIGAASGQLTVTGNIKFDQIVQAKDHNTNIQERQQLFQKRRVWIAASTHAGEEQIVLGAHLQLLNSHPDAVLILAPRHPERGDEIENLIRASGFSVVRRTTNQPMSAVEAVYLLDTLGELSSFYQYADIAFVGGSLVMTGGHNLLEPAALGRPLLTGPHLFNFQEISDLLVSSNALQIISNQSDLALKLEEIFLSDEIRFAMGSKARQVVQDNQGSVKKVMKLLDEFLPD